MTYREQLQDRYEDALFALLMDDLARQEGERYERENDALQADPTFEVPEHTRQRSEETIRRAFRRKALRQAGHISRKVFTTVSAFVFSALILTTSAFALSPQLRVTVLSYTTQVLAESTDIIAYTQDSALLDTEAPATVTVGALPEGYFLVSSSVSSAGILLKYCGVNGARLNVNVMTGIGTASFDTEDAVVSQVQINSFDATVVEKNNVVHIIWADKTHNWFVSVMAEQRTVEETIQIAESIFVS